MGFDKDDFSIGFIVGWLQILLLSSIAANFMLTGLELTMFLIVLTVGGFGILGTFLFVIYGITWLRTFTLISRKKLKELKEQEKKPHQ